MDAMSLSAVSGVMGTLVGGFATVCSLPVRNILTVWLLRASTSHM